MVKSNIKASFPYELKQVWDIVSSFQNSLWRSDLRETRIVDENNFIEFTKDGYETSFRVTLIEPYRRIEFKIENENMTGHWRGLFSQSNGRTEIDFTENIEPKKSYLGPFVKIYLKKQQKKYVRDLQMALEEHEKNEL